ncbi:MAG: hypothetical protein JW778_05335 [Candidatus Altiarchaeota archaeon]|nr:hypothetical protein [Candidatus Altiarchaeota archaeon]
MGLLDQISTGIDDFQRTSFNAQFGGGCPLCKGVNSLDRRKLEGEMHVVCENCGAVFKNLLFRGIQLIKGGEKYLGETMPLNAWRMIRFLPKEDQIIAFYSDKFVNFYATTVGIVREWGSYSFLRYSDILDIQLVKTWSVNLIHLIGFMFFLAVGLLAAVLMLAIFPEGALFFSLPFLGIAAILLMLGRKWVYQVYSPILSKKELKDWRLRKTKSKGVMDFVSVVRAQIEAESEAT